MLTVDKQYGGIVRGLPRVADLELTSLDRMCGQDALSVLAFKITLVLIESITTLIYNEIKLFCTKCNILNK